MKLLDLLLTASLLGYAVGGAIVGAVAGMLMYYAYADVLRFAKNARKLRS